MTLEQEFKKETGLDAYKLNDLRGHIAIDTYVEWLEEKCNIPVVVSSKKPYYMLVNKNGNPITTDSKLPIFWLKNIAKKEAVKFKADIKKIYL